VSGKTLSGGLVGKASGEFNISKSYASGKISGGASGGIYGIYKGGPISSSVYYNSEGATKAAGEGTPLGISGISGANMKNQESFKGWDFENIWGMDSKINNGYPYIKQEEIKQKEEERKAKIEEDKKKKEEELRQKKEAQKAALEEEKRKKEEERKQKEEERKAKLGQPPQKRR